jgi:predicted nucleotidyltransferase component of viral defense system
MLSANDLRKVASRSGARDIVNVEIDVILTYLLQLFVVRGVMNHIAFKGGTMLRKMVFGPRGRLSTDLDFTCCSDIKLDDLMIMMLDALGQPFHGLSFRFDKDKDWYMTDDGCAANPVCFHDANPKGQKIKLQVSTREQPVLPVRPVEQIKQDYFNLLPFVPSAIASLAFEEVIAEKIRAASQRSKIRDLHDLSEIAGRPINRELVRSITVLKLWNSGGEGLNYERFSERVRGSADYEIADLANLLRKDQNPDLARMINRVVESYRFLHDLTDEERILAEDHSNKRYREAASLIEKVRFAA